MQSTCRARRSSTAPSSAWSCWLAAAAAAIRWRKRFPIASFGFFVSLIFFLPTSSIMPIRDLAAERRLYLPMIGLLLILAELLVRLRWNERRDGRRDGPGGDLVPA